MFHHFGAVALRHNKVMKLFPFGHKQLSTLLHKLQCGVMFIADFISNFVFGRFDIRLAEKLLSSGAGCSALAMIIPLY